MFHNKRATKIIVTCFDALAFILHSLAFILHGYITCSLSLSDVWPRWGNFIRASACQASAPYPGSVSWGFLSVIFADKFDFRQSDVKISVASNLLVRITDGRFHWAVSLFVYVLRVECLCTPICCIKFNAMLVRLQFFLFPNHNKYQRYCLKNKYQTCDN